MLIYYKATDYCVTCVHHSFTINPCEEASIYKVWRTRAGKRLRDMFHDIRDNDSNTHSLTKDIL